MKKITAFCAAIDGMKIFVSTDSGNIHQVDVSTFRLSSEIICRELITQKYVDFDAELWKYDISEVVLMEFV